jgi:hypothetical protein
MDADRYIAGQITCHGCGRVELLIKSTRRQWARVRRCVECGSTQTTVPMWWPVEDVKAIAAATMNDLTREAHKLARRRLMQ